MICLWCESERVFEAPGGGIRYCSERCEREAMRYTIAQTDAVFDGADPPTKAEFMDRQERSRRWTPETMADRIAEFTEALS